MRDISLLNRSQPLYPKPSKPSELTFNDDSRDYLRQITYYNQIKHKMGKDKTFLPKVKNALQHG
jgi:hypothetical protein